MVKSEHKIEFESDPNNISKVEDFVDAVVKDFKVKEEIYGNILVTMTEAANNAIMHGNGGDLDKKVRMYVEETDKGLSFFVEDEGEGFNYEQLPDPTAPENVESPTGRGIFLIKQLSDEIIFHDNGRKVEVKFSIN